MSEAIALNAGEGKAFAALGDEVTVKVAGEETAGAFSFLDYTASPGFLVPPHVHRSNDEALYVLEGELAVQVGDGNATAAAGSFVFLPRGVPHALSNPGSTVTRLLVIASPAGFEKYLEEAGQLFSGGRPSGAAEMEALRQLRMKYGIEAVAPPPAER